MCTTQRHARIWLLAWLVCSTMPAAAQCAAPWQPWHWTEKTQFDGWSVYGGQRFSLIEDDKRDAFYLRNYDLALFADKQLNATDRLRTYLVINPYYRNHPQVQSSLWLIYLFWEKSYADGCLRIGKVPVPFNYRNGFPEWHSQVRRVTRVWDYGVCWSSKPHNGWQWDLAVVNDGTSPAAEWNDSDRAALVGRVRAGVGSRFEFGVSAMAAHNRAMAGIGKVHDICRYGAHIRWIPSPRSEVRAEYVDFRSLTQCGPMRPEYADKPGHGWVLEGLHQCSDDWQVFANFNSLCRDETTASQVETLTVGARCRLSDHLYLIPELWFVNDELPPGNPLYDDNRYILTALVLF